METAIIGAGIMGQLLAFFLIKAKHQVSLFDTEKAANCSLAAAGLLTPVSELEKSTTLIYRLGMEALDQHWPMLQSELNKDFHFRRAGTLLVTHPKERSESISFINKISCKFDQHDNQPYQKLSRDNLLKLEPELSKFDEAYYFPQEGQLDNQALLATLANYLKQHGVAWHQGTVDTVQPGQIIIDAEIKTFDLVFDCRGMGAKAAFPNLQGIRGELVKLHAPDVNLERPVRFQHPRYGLYIVPRPHHRYLIGATEIHTENYDPISVRSILELLTAAYYVHAGFAEARIEETLVGCRPTFPNYLPQINYSNRLIAINGLYRHGFLIAPTLAKEITRWLEGGRAALRYPEICLI